MGIKEKVLKEVERINRPDLIVDFTLSEVEKEIDAFEKNEIEVLKTEDLLKEKILIADYVKWDKFRELKKLLRGK